MNEYFLLYLLPFVSLPEEPNRPQCGSFRKAEKSASGNESGVQWREPQDRTQGQRTMFGLRGLHHPEMGMSIVLATVPVRPVCKGASVLEKPGIT